MTTATTTFELISETYFLDHDALLIARQCAKGDYQRSLVEGRARWSGADLQGAAKRYSGRYSISRDRLVAALRASGLRLTWLTAAHGRIVLVVSSEPCEVVEDGPRDAKRYRSATVTGHPAIETGVFEVL